MAARADQNLAYYLQDRRQHQTEVQENLIILNQLASALKEGSHPEAPAYEAMFEKHYRKVMN